MHVHPEAQARAWTLRQARMWVLAQTERVQTERQMWAQAERAQTEREARMPMPMQMEALVFPGAWMEWAWWALSQMEAQAFAGPQMGWALLRMGGWHMHRHVHLLRQTSHQALPAYLIACPQRRDHCEPGGACP
jgi:hypothetical protein